LNDKGKENIKLLANNVADVSMYVKEK